jgi:hypothetical protein
VAAAVVLEKEEKKLKQCRRRLKQYLKIWFGSKSSKPTTGAGDNREFW